MRAQLRSLHSPDIPGSWESFRPPSDAEWSVLVEAEIGPDDSPGGDIFAFQVCTAGWLEGQLTKGFRWGRGLLVVDRWDGRVVERAVRDLCLHTEGSDWSSIAQALSRFADWEFSNYRVTSPDT
jgi:hypothetical protein